MQFGNDQVRRVVAAIAICLFWSTALGCTAFPQTDKVVKIQIKGLNYPHAEMVFRVDSPNESDVDIFLSRHYGIRIGLEWLKGEAGPSESEQIWFDTDQSGPLVPWITCKYRF